MSNKPKEGVTSEAAWKGKKIIVNLFDRGVCRANFRELYRCWASSCWTVCVMAGWSFVCWQNYGWLKKSLQKIVRKLIDASSYHPQGFWEKKMSISTLHFCGASPSSSKTDTCFHDLKLCLFFKIDRWGNGCDCYFQVMEIILTSYHCKWLLQDSAFLS